MVRRYKLENIDVDEVGLVGRGANRRRIVYKAQKAEQTGAKRVVEALRALVRRVKQVDESLAAALVTVLANPNTDDVGELLADITEKRERLGADLADELGRLLTALFQDLEALREKRSTGQQTTEVKMSGANMTTYDEIAKRAEDLERSGWPEDEALRAAVYERIEQLAQERVVKSAGQVSQAEAIEQAFTENPELAGLYAGTGELIDVESERLKKATEPPAVPRSPGEVYAEIDKLAREVVQKSAGVLSHTQAMDRVIEQRPDLMAEYRAARDRRDCY